MVNLSFSSGRLFIQKTFVGPIFRRHLVWFSIVNKSKDSGYVFMKQFCGILSNICNFCSFDSINGLIICLISLFRACLFASRNDRDSFKEFIGMCRFSTVLEVKPFSSQSHRNRFIMISSSRDLWTFLLVHF